MKADILYWSLARILDATVWSRELINPEDLPTHYPAVFVSNHADALGPIAVTSSLPVRVYPWVIGDMVDPNHAAEYLRMDFVESQLHVPPSLGLRLAKLISIFSVRLLSAIGCLHFGRARHSRKPFD